MEHRGDSSELSDVELKAFDLLIAELEESGRQEISSIDVLFTPAILRVAVPVARITLRVTPVLAEMGPDRAENLSESEALRLLADRGELTLDELVETRRQLANR